MAGKMYDIKFKYKDALSNWEWREQSCRVSGVDMMIKFYGLDKGDVEWDIIEMKEVE